MQKSKQIIIIPLITIWLCSFVFKLYVIPHKFMIIHIALICSLELYCVSRVFVEHSIPLDEITLMYFT